jgi:hypothetical protein
MKHSRSCSGSSIAKDKWSFWSDSNFFSWYIIEGGGDWWIMIWKGFRRLRLWTNLGSTMSFDWMDGGKKRKSSAKVPSIPVETGTNDLLGFTASVTCSVHQLLNTVILEIWIPHYSEYCHLSVVTIDGVWIGNPMYWTLSYSAWLHFTVHCLTHAHTSVHSHAFTAVAW